jgi:hypothetical protein
LLKASLRAWSSCIARKITGTRHHAQLVGRGGISLTLCLDWLQTAIFLIPVFWVAGIINVSLSAWHYWIFSCAQTLARSLHTADIQRVEPVEFSTVAPWHLIGRLWVFATAKHFI